ncbi:hypothetical protein Sj15T_19080 [Sphingobium sp. TA15]|uniref:DUF3489 domain-containing protein n=1 Tax=Sphingobium indicum (strain DSM 16413 / CCM 7287 / MTCC 6362 / UT26 / NBRC 101211 / UT26S) TaxID=452662 RepID=D4Z4E2_SPHIU|nr:DUF3489 domain-containing protein [Sphingobium indicum]BAI97474.1 hypothetical protein SJA_C1-26400 [Sphingobium indicum UT26S]BDD66887.1 hypothetical protein Sj15T_19080 [Sphingobium sp. TA15]
MNSLIRFTDIQLVLLATAAQRDNGSLLPPPEAVGEGPARIRKVVEQLIRRGLAGEVDLPSGADAWRTDGLRSIGVIITDAGRAAIGVEPEEAEEPATDLPEPEVTPIAEAPSPAAHSKSALVLKMLRRESGATLDELISATNWLPHTTRAALTGLRKKGHAIDRRKRGEVTCYHLGNQA